MVDQGQRRIAMAALFDPQSQTVVAAVVEIPQQNLLLLPPAVFFSTRAVVKQGFDLTHLNAGINPALNLADTVNFLFVKQAVPSVGAPRFQQSIAPLPGAKRYGLMSQS